MDNNIEKRYRSALISDTARDNAQEYQKQSITKRRQIEDDFFKKEIDYRDYIFSPEGYEGLVLALYILILPYLAGLSFLFLFVAEASYEYFLEFKLSSFMVIWAIGYEVCAVLILLIIFLAWVRHVTTRVSREQARKPKKRQGW